MTTPRNKIWFPAKTYGWGWGPPVCWQGWVVLLAYIVLILGGVLLFLPEKDNIPWFLFYTIILTLILIWICWLKGEKPKWRWGKGKDERRSPHG